MNAIPDSYVVNSCQYTPVYLIQDPGDSQGQSYFIAQSNVEEPKPVSDNLKAFYESSGNIEGLTNVSSSPRPRILKKQDTSAIGNNLKLASFLQPKKECHKQQYLLNSKIVKPNASTNNINNNTTYTTGNNTIFNIDSKIVKLKDVALKTRRNRIERVPQPKNNKPKDVATAAIPVTVQTIQVPLNVQTVAPMVLSNTPVQALPSKHTSVQLLKLGETYHSLNQLSDEQMTMVTQALKMFNNPEKNTPEPAYDPVTNTQFIYKVVSPRDLTVVSKNEVPQHKQLEAARIEKIMQNELRKEILRETARKEYAQECKNEHLKEIAKKENAKKELLERYKAKQDAFVAEAKAERLRAEARNENVFKAEAKREMMAKAEAKREMLAKAEAKRESILKAKVEARKEEMRKEELRKLELKKENPTKKIHKSKILHQTILEEQELAIENETKVTRSGRKVKLPKQRLPEDTPNKPKKFKTTLIPCFQCSSKFESLYRLQKHYDSHPTHIPAKIHSDLFRCLLAIVLSGAEGDRRNIFVQQLQQLILKLRSLIPCLLAAGMDDEGACTVPADVASLLGIYPGKYNFDMEALDCVKTTEGFCGHYPPPPPHSIIEPDTTANQTWAVVEELPTSEIELDDCARINSVEKWPTVNKRVWKQKQNKSASDKAKRMRLASENDTMIELGIDDYVVLNTNCAEEHSGNISPQDAADKSDSHIVNECNNFEDSMKLAQEPESLSLPRLPEPNDYLNEGPSLQPSQASLEQIATTIANLEEQNKQNNHLQFHSAHFDIRSSPIKPTSTIFRKFQINPELLAKYETQTIQSIEIVDKNHDLMTPLVNNETNNLADFDEIPEQNIDTTLNKVEINENSTDHLVGDDTLGEIFKDEDISAVKESFILEQELKDWILNRSNDEKSEDGFGKSNTIIEPSLIHVKDAQIKSVTDEIEQKVVSQPDDNHDESSVLNFLENFGNDSLSFPGTEIRTNGDFQLDLFSFHSSS